MADLAGDLDGTVFSRERLRALAGDGENFAFRAHGAGVAAMSQWGEWEVLSPSMRNLLDKAGLRTWTVWPSGGEPAFLRDAILALVPARPKANISARRYRLVTGKKNRGMALATPRSVCILRQPRCIATPELVTMSTPLVSRRKIAPITTVITATPIGYHRPK
jgi:hypothetical protein